MFCLSFKLIIHLTTRWPPTLHCVLYSFGLVFKTFIMQYTYTNVYCLVEFLCGCHIVEFAMLTSDSMVLLNLHQSPIRESYLLLNQWYKIEFRKRFLKIKACFKYASFLLKYLIALPNDT